MLPETKILIDAYKKEYDSYHEYLKNNSWEEDVYLDEKGNLGSAKLDTERSIIGTILTTMKKLKEDIEPDLDKKKVVDFFKYVVEIVDIHLKRIENYKRNNPLGNEESMAGVDVEFHSQLFSLLTKTKLGLSKIDITSSNKKSLDLFRGNEKSTLVMRDYLCNTFPLVKNLTDNLGINFNAPSINPSTSKEMFINMKEKDIPKWDSSKHYFEQEKSTLEFWEEEMNKIRNGVSINGYKISPWLYWHMNFFMLSRIDQETGFKKIAPPDLRDSDYYFDQMSKKAREIGNVGLFMYGTRRFGKALKNTEKIYYADGSIREIGDCKKGDIIIGGDGKPTEILGVYPQGKVKLFKVVFGDGRQVVCCSEHLWNVYDMQSRRYKVLPLKEILKCYKYSRDYKDRKDNTVYNYYIPLNKPIEYKEPVNPFIDPYFLGTWLGDGTSRSVSITTTDDSIIDYWKQISEKEGLEFKCSGKYLYKIVKRLGSRNTILDTFNKYGLIKNKHIPLECFSWSVEDRMALLQGLMDTDGYASVGGQMEFVNANRELFDGFVRLCRELGIGIYPKYDLKGHYVKDNGTFNTYNSASIFTDKDVFRLNRKLDRISGNKLRKNRSRFDRVPIVDIIEVEEDFATCIRVDNSDSLFLTTNCIVTHNSVIIASHVQHGLYTIPNCSARIQGFSENPDLIAINNYIQDSTNNMHPALRFPANTIDLTAGVNLGLKSKSGTERYDMSRLMYVNLEGGNTSKGGQKTAGSTPDIFVFDEALSEDSLLWTSDGGITMSDVKVGDSIYGADGNLTKVLEKIDVGVKPLYRLTLRNGNYVDACGDHLWEVKNKLSGKGRIEVKTTNELLSDYLKNGVRSKYSIRKSCPIKFPFKEVDIDPYWLGLWLGDGTNNNTCITTTDDEIMDYVERYSNKLSLLFKKKLLVEKHRKTPTYRVSMVKPKGSPNVIINQLRGLNIFRNKHIPDIFKFNSIDVRLSVLQGLVDTEGYVDKKGRVSITLGNKRLFDDTLWLIESLGIAASKVGVRTIKGKDYHVVSFNTDLDVCRLSRKKSRRRAPLSKKGVSNLKWVSLVDITPIGDKQAYCIKVDNKDRLFVTNNFMVTHNCGKGPLITSWMAAIPSFAGGKDGKFRCLPVLSGCVCAGTKVYTASGELVNIEDITKETGILGYNGDSKSVENIPWIQPPKQKECVRIETALGKTLECSTDHPLMVVRDNKSMFIRSKDVKAGDSMLLYSGPSIFGKKNIYHADLIGLMIGDGYYGGGYELSISDVDVYNHILDRYYYLYTGDKVSSDSPWYRSIKLKGLAGLFEYHGIKGDTKKNKKLPVDINEWDEESVASLLRGYFEADGYISKEANKRRISLTSYNKELLESVKNQLERFGIYSNIYHRVRNRGKTKGVSSIKGIVEINNNVDCYYLDITRSEFVLKFHDKIGFMSERKNNRLRNAVDSIDPSSISNSYEYVDSGIGKGEYFNGKICSNVSRIKVKSVENIGMKDIYNLTAGVTHTYITNGFISHNTAGDAELSREAEIMLKSPEKYYILPMDWDILDRVVDPEYATWERGKTFGMFVPAQMSLEGPVKLKKTLNEFLGTSNPRLNDINIYVTDWEKANKFHFDSRDLVKDDLNLLSKRMNSFPMDIDDCYLTSEINIFPTLLCQERRDYINKEGLSGQPYRFYRDQNGEIRAKMDTWDNVITEYPYKGGSTDSPVMVLENPLSEDKGEIPLGLYVMGLDDIKMDKTDGDSIASATIFKRSYEGGEWANRIVAYYDSRPARKADYYRQLHMVMKAYNCRVLFENADNGFIEWVETNYPEDVMKHFSEGVGLASEENLHRNNNRKFGWTPTAHNIYLLNQKIIAYTMEDNVVVAGVENLDGVSRINSPMLLEEMIRYKKDQNADRLRSFGLALTLARYYDNTYRYMKNRKRVSKSDKDSPKNKTRTSYGGLVYDSRLNRRYRN